VLFVTAGSGITPVMGMLRTHLANLDDVVLVHSAPSSEDVIFAAELAPLAETAQLRLVQRHTDTDGMITTEDLTTLVGDLAEREAWACGPSGMLDALDELYASIGIPDQLHTERFRATTIVAGDGGDVTFTLACGASETVVPVDGATTLLDAGEDAGLLMPSGCRMGICFGCVLPLREGAVRDLRTGQLTDASEGNDIVVQTCISAAAGPCRLDLP
jgi:ferredoxin-NADP reductase